jgi:hypothetical protein
VVDATKMRMGMRLAKTKGIHGYLPEMTELYAIDGKKTALFEPFIYKMHYFTKTGSGQT